MSSFPPHSVHPDDSWKPPFSCKEALRLRWCLAQRQALSLKELAGSSCPLRIAASRSSRSRPTLQTESAQTVNSLSLDSHPSKNPDQTKTSHPNKTPGQKPRQRFEASRGYPRASRTQIEIDGHPLSTRSKNPDPIKTTPPPRVLIGEKYKE